MHSAIQPLNNWGQHLTFSVAVRSSLAQILRRVCWCSVAMVTRFDGISSRWSSQFGVKLYFFQLLSTIKVNLVAKIMQSAYLCVIFHVKHRTLPFLEVLTWFPILSDQDGDRCWWRHRPPAAPQPSSCSEGQRLSTKGTIVSKYCNISKTPGRGSIHLPPPLCTTVGY